MRGKNEFIFLKMEIRVWWFMAVRTSVRVSPGEPWKPQVSFSWVKSPGNLSPWFSEPHWLWNLGEIMGEMGIVPLCLSLVAASEQPFPGRETARWEGNPVLWGRLEGHASQGWT